ncbi:Uncharacterised protein [Mycobacteroides abscessus]|nr:Uncharacterised protein [Mycobacteroides abscessus]
MSGDAFERAVERAERKAEEDQQRLARKRLEWIARMNRTAFQIHASTYAAVQVLLIVIWHSPGDSTTAPPTPGSCIPCWAGASR